MIGAAVAEALHRVGPEGVVTLEESDVPEIAVDFVEGMHVENGWISPYMVRDPERMETVFEDPHIFMTNKPLSHPNDLLPVLDLVSRDPRPLVVLAEKVDGGALGMLVANTQHRTLEAVAVRAPGFGHRRVQHLGDLAAFCGGAVIAEEAGLKLEDVRAEHLGTARRVIVTTDSTVFIEGGGTTEAVDGRLSMIRAELARAVHERDVEILQERLARLATSLAVIRVGAATDVVRNERFRRAEGVAGRHAGGGRRGDRAGRRDGAAAQRRRARRAASWRATTRAASRWSAACSPSRCTGSPATPATTATRRSTRSRRCRPATGSTR